MLRHALRTATVSAVIGAAAFLSVPAASAQDATTTVAAAVDTAAPVADTAAVAPVAETAAATPAGGVAAGGGFLTKDSGTPVLPIVLVVGAAGAGAAIFASRRRKA
jgi:hypothetical protein